jgi:hypothetical protein
MSSKSRLERVMAKRRASALSNTQPKVRGQAVAGGNMSGATAVTTFKDITTIIEGRDVSSGFARNTIAKFITAVA